MNKNSILKIVLLCGIITCYINTVSADSSIIYVNPSGNDSWDGQYPVWQNGTSGPKLTITNATATVTNGGIVQVANGIYYENNITITNKTIQINGEDKNSTIIDGNNIGKIFNVDPGASLTLSKLSIINGSSSAIINYGTLSVNDCIFKENSNLSGSGGAIHSEGNNDALAIVNIKYSYFINNSASEKGGAIFGLGTCVFNIYGSDFVNNRASDAGAIYNECGSFANVHFNRFIGNSPIGSVINSFYGDFDASRNWWGSNENPSSQVTSKVTVTPWLVLSIKADPINIGVNTDSIITLDIQHDSTGTYYNPITNHVPDGIISTFTPGLYGIVNPNENTFLNGFTTTTFTAKSIGISEITATVDNQLISIPINIINFPIINTRTSKGYFTIQSAINNTDTLDGDTIIVDSTASPYVENITINKLLVISANGAVTVQALNINLPVFSINNSGSGSVITGFNITGSTKSYGISMDNSMNNTISYNNIYNNYGGVSISDSSANTILSNNIYLNYFAIDIFRESDNNNITSNIISNNTYSVSLYDGSDNTINDNVITGTSGESIFIYGSNLIWTGHEWIIGLPLTGTNVYDNTIIGGSTGIYLFNGASSSFTNNHISNCLNSGITIETSVDTNMNSNTINGILNNQNTLFGIELIHASGLNQINENNITNCGDNIYLNSTSGTSITGNIIYNATNTGISLESTNNCSINGNTIRENPIGIKFYDSNHNTITNNSIQNNIWTGIYLDKSTENIINNTNNIKNNHDGIFLVNNSILNHISNNIVENNVIGLSLITNSNDNIISNNTIYYNDMMGMFINNSNNNQISGNTIQSNGWLGICLDNTDTNTIDFENEISGNGEGIYIVNASNGNNISGNNIHHNLGAGINILNNSVDNFISDNLVMSNGVIGILVRDSDANTISHNSIGINGWAGIALDNADDNTINLANNISGNLEGLNITQSNGNIITGNTINGNNNIGISIINGSVGNGINFNNISYNGIIGFYLRDSNTNTASENNIQGNGWVGVCFDNATGNNISNDNNISSNLEGLYIVNNSNNNTLNNNNIHENQDTGIYIDSSTENQITSNTAISNNGAIGILLRNANSNHINWNIIEGNSFAGIALDNADSNFITGANTIIGNQMGIYIVNNSTGNTVTGNTLQGNTWAGIVLDAANNTMIYKNNFINNPLQALAQNGSGNALYQDTTGNFWNDWPSTEPRSIYGNEILIDHYPSITPFN